MYTKKITVVSNDRQQLWDEREREMDGGGWFSCAKKTRQRGWWWEWSNTGISLPNISRKHIYFLHF